MNVKEIHGMTLFVNPCIFGHNYVVKLLFDHWDSKNIDLNGRDIDGLTPLMRLINLNVKDTHGLTPF